MRSRAQIEDMKQMMRQEDAALARQERRQAEMRVNNVVTEQAVNEIIDAGGSGRDVLDLISPLILKESR